MNDSIDAEKHNLSKPGIVEIIGLAGAGKTTLSKALGKYPDHFRLSRFPSVHQIASAPFFIRYGAPLLPNLFRLYRRTSRQLGQREFAWMTILSGWPDILQQQANKGQKVIVLDQGPVYLLAEFKEFGPEYLQSERAEKLWQKIYCRWAGTLDLIVWLDADNTYLMERIQNRAKGHKVKNESMTVVTDFLTRYRAAYDYVVSRLGTCPGGPRILRIDTGSRQPQETADYLLTTLGLS
jgi:deoxyadenosine/deoxycytidine kinase